MSAPEFAYYSHGLAEWIVAKDRLVRVIDQLDRTLRSGLCTQEDVEHKTEELAAAQEQAASWATVASRRKGERELLLSIGASGREEIRARLLGSKVWGAAARRCFEESEGRLDKVDQLAYVLRKIARCPVEGEVGFGEQHMAWIEELQSWKGAPSA